MASLPESTHLCTHPRTWRGPASVHVEGNLLVLQRTTFSSLFALKCPSDSKMIKCIKMFSVASCILRNDSYACYRNVWKDCIYLCHHHPTPLSIMPLMYFFHLANSGCLSLDHSPPESFIL